MVSSNAILTSTAMAHFLTTGCALLLMRRGPNRRLRLLTVTVGLMSLSQTITLLQSAGLWQAGSMYLGGLNQTLIGGLSLLAIQLLAKEIYDRKFTDRRLRLVEHETSSSFSVAKPEHRAANPFALVSRSIVEPWRFAVGQAKSVEQPHAAHEGMWQPAVVRANAAESTVDLLMLLGAIEEHAHRARGCKAISVAAG